MKRHYSFLLFLLIAPLLFMTCKKDDEGNTIVNIFSVDDDIKMGKRMDEYFRNPDSSGLKILKREDYPVAYNYIENIKTQILNSGSIRYKDEFEWKIGIIHDDQTLNAFATPGGYIFVYTGLIKYLDCGDHLAGVMGHEIAHSDKRHSTNQLTKQYGVSTLLGIVLGNGTISQVSQSLLSLKFSRDDENDADENSVKYLCNAPHISADGAAGFFQKLIDGGHSSSTLEFLSTHPSSDKRVENIRSKAKELGCGVSETCTDSDTYQDVKNSLPN